MKFSVNGKSSKLPFMAKSTNSKKQAPKASQKKSKDTSDMQPKASKIAATSDEKESGLQKLFADGIKDIYWAENHLVKGLPKLIKAAASKELQNALTDHLEVTKKHVTRLELVFENLGKKIQAKKCDAMEGLSKEAEGVIETTDAGTAAREQGLIMAAQKTEHYEIASYSGLSKLASTLGYSDISSILEQTLAEEKEADELLATIAENSKVPDNVGR